MKVSERTIFSFIRRICRWLSSKPKTTRKQPVQACSKRLATRKIYDDKELEWEMTQDRYRSPIPEKLRWRNCAADSEGITGDALLEFCNNELFPTLKELSVGTTDNRGATSSAASSRTPTSI